MTKETTTLYASDRDVFLFLVDDLNPTAAGLLPDGSTGRIAACQWVGQGPLWAVLGGTCARAYTLGGVGGDV